MASSLDTTGAPAIRVIVPRVGDDHDISGIGGSSLASSSATPATPAHSRLTVRHASASRLRDGGIRCGCGTGEDVVMKRLRQFGVLLDKLLDALGVLQRMQCNRGGNLVRPFGRDEEDKALQGRETGEAQIKQYEWKGVASESARLEPHCHKEEDDTERRPGGEDGFHMIGGALPEAERVIGRHRRVFAPVPVMCRAVLAEPCGDVTELLRLCLDIHAALASTVASGTGCVIGCGVISPSSCQMYANISYQFAKKPAAYRLPRVTLQVFASKAAPSLKL